VTPRNIFEDLGVTPEAITDSIIVVRADPVRAETLRQIGLLATSAIVVSTENDAVTTNIILAVHDLLEKARRKLGDKIMKTFYGDKIVAAEVASESIARRLIASGLVDGAVASRSLAGKLIAYAIYDIQVFRMLLDLISSTEGLIDVRQYLLSPDVWEQLELPENTTFAELAVTLAEKGIGIPVAVYKHRERRLHKIPESNLEITQNDIIIVITERT